MKKLEALKTENEELRAKLEESQVIIRAIKNGEVDAIVVSGFEGEKIYTLTGAEQIYRILVETINEGALVLSSDGFIVYCNHSIAAMLGLPINKVIGSNICEFAADTDANLIKDMMEHVKLHSSRMEINLNNISIGSIPVLVSIGNLKSEGVQSVYMIVTDLTAYKKTENELEKYREHLEDLVDERTKRLDEAQKQCLKLELEKVKALQKSIEMKDEFLSLISHEFKTPLTVINSAVQAMRLFCKYELSDKANKYLGSILQNSNRQLKLVNNLLDITRINAGCIKINLTNIDIIITTRKITESIMTFADQKGIRLSFSSTLEKKIIGIDEEKYERILLNLLSNAIKFTPRGKSIFVRTSQKVVGGRCKVCIEVKDQGIGIPHDKQQLIFERFGQVDSSLSRQAEGTGIGLSLVKLFIALMGGKIAVESEVEKGSIFTILFPITKIKETPIEKMLQEIYNNRLIQATAIEFSDIY